jgi:transposase
MRKRHEITEEQASELEVARKKNKNKNVEKRLKVLVLFAGGLKREEIAKQTGFAKSYVSEIVAKYVKFGLKAITGNHYRGNRRNMSVAEEALFLATWRERAEKGEMVEVSEIKNAYCERVGHTIGGQQIYLVLRRHGWRKVMPRSQHPNKASDEAIEA